MNTPQPQRDNRGRTHVADGVVASIAGVAARRVPGVHRMGSSQSRTLDAVRETFRTNNIRSGIRVDVTNRTVAVDVVLIADFGVPVRDVADRVRLAVHDDVERLVGREVTEVNVEIADVYVADQRKLRHED